MLRMVPDDKRTKIGPTGPVRPVTSQAMAAVVTPAPVTPPPATAGTPAPGHGSTSYLPPHGDPLLGQILAGRYLIQKKLGEGGMGAVYLATHNLLDKQVALKVLHGEFSRKADLVERFMQEAKAASRIRHENVIDISDFGTTPDGLVFFAMELLHGHDLHEEVARARLAGQLLPWGRSKKIFLQLCSALSAAHGLGIIHRDLKPENIYLVDFLGEPDFVKLLDFGIAKQTELAEGDRKLTRTGMLFGTPEYMSPEQARGEPDIDRRVDVYAMGCILFQLVTGRVPFEAENFMGVLSLHLTEPPPVIPTEIFDTIGAPRALAAVIDRALAKDRNQRYASIDELGRAVRHASGDQASGPVVAQASVPAPSSTASLGRVKTQWTGNLSVPELDQVAAPRRSKLPLVIGALALVGGAAGAAVLLSDRGGAGPPPLAGSPIGGAAPTPAPAPRAAPAPPISADSPFAFEHAHIRLDSVPSGAEVKQLPGDTVIARTPCNLKLTPSHKPITFVLHHASYDDAVIDITPDRERIDHTEKLVRGAPGRPGRKPLPVTRPADPVTRPADPVTRPADPVTRPADPVTRPADPVTRPADPVTRPADPVTRPDPPRPPPVDDPELLPLKGDPSRSGSGQGGAP
jgi:eukaryotic-like serine/threonine-protein kinase